MDSHQRTDREQTGGGQQLGDQVAAVIIERRVRQVALGVQREGGDRDAGEGEQPGDVDVGARAHGGEAQRPGGGREQEQRAEQRTGGVEAAVRLRGGHRQAAVHQQSERRGDEEDRGQQLQAAAQRAEQVIAEQPQAGAEERHEADRGQRERGESAELAAQLVVEIGV